MKKILRLFIFAFIIISCSSSVQIIKLEIKENQLFIEDKKIALDDFEKEVNRLTEGLSSEKLRKVSFTLTIDGKTNMGVVSDLKTKKENWKKAQENN